MIDQVIYAKNRPDLEAAVKALDRILLWNFYVVPQWSYSYSRVARWDRFSHPDPLPRFGVWHFRPCGGGMPKKPQRRVSRP